jgi:hypothetical protein
MCERTYPQLDRPSRAARRLQVCEISSLKAFGPHLSAPTVAGDSLLLAALGLAGHHRPMTKYLISFPSDAMQLTPEEFQKAGEESRAVILEAKAAGVYVFGGGIDESVDAVLVAQDGSVRPDTYPGSELNGGFTVLELPTREDAVEWARKIAAACRCPQELREFMYDPIS